MKIRFDSNISKILLGLLLLVSCSKDHDPAKPEPEKVLIEFTKLANITAASLKNLIVASKQNINPNLMVSDVEVYKVTYETSYKENTITASGLVVLPLTTSQSGMVSFQHGTIVMQSEAPTAQAPGTFEVMAYAILASPGFIVAVPDYIGFGASKELFHPYYVEEATASAVIDNLKAAKELAEQKEISFNGKLFLAGYSQGGYATMATHKAIETTPLEGFTLTASFPAAGGYDIAHIQQYLFSQENYPQPHYLAYIAMSYIRHYDYPNVIQDMFNEPYASRIPSLFDGIKSSGEINSQLTKHIPSLLKGEFITGIDTQPKYSYLRQLIADNSLLDWTPTISMTLYHGDQDNIVPYANSLKTYQAFLDRGASAEKIKFITLPGADHSTGAQPYVVDVLHKVIALK